MPLRSLGVAARGLLVTVGVTPASLFDFEMILTKVNRHNGSTFKPVIDAAEVYCV
jgi:hypothetical protein